VTKYIKLTWAGPVARMEDITAFKILRAKPAGMRPLGRSWHRWEDNARVEVHIHRVLQKV
jgi:hypothetical protein